MKKISPSEKKDLRFLVEDFLELDASDILKDIESNGEEARSLWDRLENLLFKDSIGLDDVDQEDKDTTDFKKLVLEYHTFLKPIWDQFKMGLSDYRERIIPGRKLSKEVKIDESSPMHEFRELFSQDSVLDFEHLWEIKITVSFDPGHVTFYKRSINILKNFIDFLDGVDISYFGFCDLPRCRKCIIKTRSDKEYCRGCAAKRKQDDEWEKDKKGMQKKERDRYHIKRKGK